MKKLMTLAGVLTVAAMAIGTSGCGSSSTSTHPTTTPAAKLAYVQRSAANSGAPVLFTLDPTTGVSTQASLSINPVASYVSSDSTATAATYCYDVDDVDYGYDIYSVGTSNQEVQLTTGANACQSVYSPDGSTIAYVSGAGGADTVIYTMNADGSNQQAVFPISGHNEFYPYFSPDGSTLVFYIQSDVDSDVAGAARRPKRPGKSEWLQSLSKKSKVRGNVTPNGAYNPPEGWYIMTLSNPSPTLVYTPEDRAWGNATFTTDGTKLLLNDNYDVYSINLDGTGLAPLTTYQDDDAYDFGAVEFNGQIFYNRSDNADESFDIYQENPDGSAQSLFVTSATETYSTLLDSFAMDW